jgi:hypothetical protein
MYLLGHIAIGYLVVWGFARWRKEKFSLWLALTVGIVPDYDILFRGLGLAHHTYTHSLLLWAPVVIALVLWNRKTLPYVAGILSHLLIGDFLVSSVPLLLPISNISVGLRFGMPSFVDAILESSSLALMFLLMWRNGDLRNMLSGQRSNLLILVPLVSMVSLTWLAAKTPGVEELVAFGFSKLELEAVSVGQIVLMIFFIASIALSCIKLVRLRKSHKLQPSI